MVWSQGRNPNDVVAAGYDVVNATWTPLYIVRDNKKSLEQLFRWNPKLFGREGSNEYTLLKDPSRLRGAQLCSWENSESIEIQSMRDRLAAVAERTWNSGEGNDDFAGFKQRLTATDAALERLVDPLRIEIHGSPADFTRDENSFVEPIEVALVPNRPRRACRSATRSTTRSPTTSG